MRPPATCRSVMATPVATLPARRARAAASRKGCTRAWSGANSPAGIGTSSGTSSATWSLSSSSTPGHGPPGGGPAGNSCSPAIRSSPNARSQSWSSWRYSARLARASATKAGGSLSWCSAGANAPPAPPEAAAASRAASMTSTRLIPARRQNTAVASPITPPPTTSTSGWRSRSAGIPGSRAARSAGSTVLAHTVPCTRRIPKLIATG
jgi:hypothetical protein